MIQCTFGTLASNVIVDQATNNMSLIDVFENITVTSLPLVLPSLAAVFAFTRGTDDPQDITVQVEVETNGTVRHVTQVPVNFGGKARTRLIMRLGGFVVMEAGRFGIKVSLNGQELFQYPVQVELSSSLPEAQVFIHPER